MLDLSNKVKHQTNFTTQSDGVIIFNVANVGGTINVGGVVFTTPSSGLAQTVVDGVSAGTVVTMTASLFCNCLGFI